MLHVGNIEFNRSHKIWRIVKTKGIWHVTQLRQYNNWAFFSKMSLVRHPFDTQFYKLDFDISSEYQTFELKYYIISIIKEYRD